MEQRELWIFRLFQINIYNILYSSILDVIEWNYSLHFEQSKPPWENLDLSLDRCSFILTIYLVEN